MPLQSTTRIVFERNTLTAVVALLRFPTILRIQAEPPMAFQDRIRSEFPVYQVVDNTQLQMPSDVPAEVQMAVRAGIQGAFNIPLQRVHRFSTEDSNWTVQLNQESLGLTCKDYPHWEAFRDKWDGVFEVLKDIYHPAFATALALRYRNAIVRSKLDLVGVRWRELLNPAIGAEFCAPELEDGEIISSGHRLELSLGAIGKARIQHGLGKFNPTGEDAYVIDNEFVTDQRIGLDHVTERLNAFHDYSGRLFNFCVSDRLKSSLRPQGI